MIKVTPRKTFLLHFILQVSKNYLCRYFPIFFPLSWFIILLLTLLAFEKSIYWLSTSELQPCPSGMDPCALASSTWFPSWLALGSNLSSHPLQGMEFCLEIWFKHNAAIDAPKILIQDCRCRSSTKSQSNSLQPHGLRRARLPCPSPSPGIYWNSCPSSHWCYPIHLILCHPLFLLPSIFPSHRPFPVSGLFASGGLSVKASVSASILHSWWSESCSVMSDSSQLHELYIQSMEFFRPEYWSG